MPGGYGANNGTPYGRPQGGSSSMPLPMGEFTTITGRPAPDRNGEGDGFRDELQGVVRERDELQGAVISLTQALKRAEATAQNHEKVSSFPGSNSLFLAVTARSVLWRWFCLPGHRRWLRLESRRSLDACAAHQRTANSGTAIQITHPGLDCLLSTTRLGRRATRC